jgi:integrase
MSNLPAPISVPGPLAPYLAMAERYVRSAKAANTIRAYRSDWADFERFCTGRGLPSLPAVPATVAAYAAEGAGRLKARTVERRLTAIAQAHDLAGLANPAADKLVRTVMAGVRRLKGTAQRGKEPLSPELLRRMFAQPPADLLALRDRALLLVGFAGALRRSELVGLRHEDARFTAEGVVITIRQSKTDQDGAGQSIGIPYGSRVETCPVQALREWLERAEIRSGFLFRGIGRWGREAEEGPIGDHQLARIVKRRVLAAGLEAAEFSGHSLRSGLATAAAEGGASERSIMDQTRHRSVKQARKYIRRGSLFRDNAAARSGL